MISHLTIKQSNSIKLICCLMQILITFIPGMYIIKFSTGYGEYSNSIECSYSLIKMMIRTRDVLMLILIITYLICIINIMICILQHLDNHYLCNTQVLFYNELAFLIFYCISSFLVCKTYKGTSEITIHAKVYMLFWIEIMLTIGILVFSCKTNKLLIDNDKTNRISKMDELLKYKKLLDLDVITKEDFDKLKKELIDL